MRIWPSILLILGSSAIVLAATTMPSAPISNPSTRPTVRRGFGNTGSGPNLATQRLNSRTTPRRELAPSRGLPTIYEEVAVRNIFIKGDQRPVPAPAGNSAPDPYAYQTLPVDLVLTGVSVEDKERVAFLENQQQDLVMKVKVGDKISTGKVVDIEFQSIDYQTAGGPIIRVDVGYNLAGGSVWGVSSGGATTQASTRPSLSGPRQPGESMEDYLRRRRAEESGH